MVVASTCHTATPLPFSRNFPGALPVGAGIVLVETVPSAFFHRKQECRFSEGASSEPWYRLHYAITRYCCETGGKYGVPFVLGYGLSLSDHFKSGQRLSLQNRPTE